MIKTLKIHRNAAKTNGKGEIVEICRVGWLMSSLVEADRLVEVVVVKKGPILCSRDEGMTLCSVDGRVGSSQGLHIPYYTVLCSTYEQHRAGVRSGSYATMSKFPAWRRKMLVGKQIV